MILTRGNHASSLRVKTRTVGKLNVGKGKLLSLDAAVCAVYLNKHFGARHVHPAAICLGTCVWRLSSDGHSLCSVPSSRCSLPEVSAERPDPQKCTEWNSSDRPGPLMLGLPLCFLFCTLISECQGGAKLGDISLCG